MSVKNCDTVFCASGVFRVVLQELGPDWHVEQRPERQRDDEKDVRHALENAERGTGKTLGLYIITDN